MSKYPKIKNPDLVGTYSALTKSGGGYVWDDVLEYRVWCHPHDGAPDSYEGEDYYYCFDNFEDAPEFSKATKGAEEPLALILQEEYIDEPEPGRYIHKKGPRITEWRVEWLDSPRRNASTIREFINKGAR